MTLTSRSENEVQCSVHVLFQFDENQFGVVGIEAKTWYDLHSGMTLTSRSCILKVTESDAVIYTRFKPGFCENWLNGMGTAAKKRFEL